MNTGTEGRDSWGRSRYSVYRLVKIHALSPKIHKHCIYMTHIHTSAYTQTYTHTHTHTHTQTHTHTHTLTRTVKAPGSRMYTSPCSVPMIRQLMDITSEEFLGRVVIEVMTVCRLSGVFWNSGAKFCISSEVI